MSYSRIFLSHLRRWNTKPIENFRKIFMRRISRLGSNAKSSNLNPIFFPTLLSISFSLQAKYDPKLEEKKMLQQADDLFNDHKFEELSTLLKSVASWYDNSEILWRVARCQFHQIKYMKNLDRKEHKRILENSLLLVQRSVSLNNESGFAHKWAAIILDAYSANEGLKNRVSQLYNVLNHMENAIKYSPHDPTSYYILGEWHFGCSSLSWIEKNLIKFVYGKLPDASMEKALEMFEKAEQIEPEFYSKNLIMIVKSMIALNREPEKIKSFLETINKKYKNSDKWDDKEAYNDAQKLFKKYGVND